jgi:hypothetical protein
MSRGNNEGIVQKILDNQNGMKFDEYGEVINHEDTYNWIANDLTEGLKPVLVGWTDQNGTHLDILFTFWTKKYGTNIQGGISPSDLFVSIMRVGAFGFEVTDEGTHQSYYDEKLSGRFGTLGIECSDKLAELINGVRKAIFKNLS